MLSMLSGWRLLCYRYGPTMHHMGSCGKLNTQFMLHTQVARAKHRSSRVHSICQEQEVLSTCSFVHTFSHSSLCYAKCFRAGNWASGPDFGRIVIGKASESALRPAEGPIFKSPQEESGQNPARFPDRQHYYVT